MIRRTPAIFTKKSEETIEENQKKVTFENITIEDIKKTFSLKDVGLQDDNVPTVKDVKKLISELKSDEVPVVIESPKTLDDIQDGKTYVRFSIEDKEKLNLIEKGADVTTPQKVKSSGATMNNDENIKNNKWVADDFTSNTDQKVPTQKSVRIFVDSSLSKLQASFIQYFTDFIHKIFPPDSIARSDDKGNIIPLKPRNNTLIGRLGGFISDLTSDDVRKLINVEDGADKTSPQKVKSSGATMNNDESIKGNKWVIDEDDMKSNSSEKVPTQKSVVSFISSLFKTKTTDDLKEGNVHKYFNNKTQDDLPDGKTCLRFSKEDKLKLSDIQDKADVTTSGRVKSAGATMNNDASVKGKAWVTTNFNEVTDDKVPTQKAVKEFIENRSSDDIKEGSKNKYFNEDKTSDNLKEGIVNKYFSGKTTDDLKEGKVNKYLTPASYNNIKEDIIKDFTTTKTSDDIKQGKANKYLTPNTSSDDIKEGKKNKYLSGKTTDDLPEGERNKYFRQVSHSELNNIVGGDIHLTDLQAKDLLSGGASLAHTHQNIPDINLKEDAKFNGLKAIELCCDNGPKVPTTPKVGQWFLHTPKRRKILLQYDGKKWVPIFSDEPITFYVDDFKGNDIIDNGTDTGSLSFKTINYAINQIPKNINQNIFILISAGTYTENITINGNYSITFIGMLQKLFSAVVDSSITGSGVSQGYINDSDSFGKYEHKLLYSSKGNEYRIIDSDVSDRATICGCWDLPPNGEYSVFDWATKLVGDINITNCNSRIQFIDFKFQNPMYKINGGDLIKFIRCEFDCYLNINQGKIKVDQCILKQKLNITNNSICQFYNTKFISNEDYILKVGYASNVKIGKGCIFEGSENTTGIISYIKSIIDMESTTKEGYNIIRNCDTGVYVKQYGMIVNSENVQYINNNLKKNIIYSSNGYID